MSYMNGHINYINSVVKLLCLQCSAFTAGLHRHTVLHVLQKFMLEVCRAKLHAFSNVFGVHCKSLLW